MHAVRNKDLQAQEKVKFHVRFYLVLVQWTGSGIPHPRQRNVASLQQLGHLEQNIKLAFHDQNMYVHMLPFLHAEILNTPAFVHLSKSTSSSSG